VTKADNDETSTLFTLCLCMKLILAHYRYIYGVSFCTLPMDVSWRGTFVDSIDDLCVVFFTMLIICELQETELERGLMLRRLVPRLK
jgi:hypothetical protein